MKKWGWDSPLNHRTENSGTQSVRGLASLLLHSLPYSQAGTVPHTVDFPRPTVFTEGGQSWKWTFSFLTILGCITESILLSRPKGNTGAICRARPPGIRQKQRTLFFVSHQPAQRSWQLLCILASEGTPPEKLANSSTVREAWWTGHPGSNPWPASTPSPCALLETFPACEVGGGWQLSAKGVSGPAWSKLLSFDPASPWYAH